MTHDFEIAQGDVLPYIRQTITFASAVDLTGAAVKFRYAEPDSATVERDATFTPSPNAAAATSAVLEYRWVPSDTANANVRRFQWKFVMGDGYPLHVPTKSPTCADPLRVWQTFEVTPVV